MSKFFLAKIIAFVTMLVLLVGFAFFKKEKEVEELSESEIERQQLIEDVRREKESKELSIEDRERNKIKAIAENFTSMYYSYKLNDYSNMYLLKDEMTDRFWNEKSEWLEKNSGKVENDPKRYIHFNVCIQSSEVINLNDNEADISVRYIHEEIKGGMIQGEITIKYVDEFGKELKESNPFLPVKRTEKIVLVKLVKENDKWKLDGIGENGKYYKFCR